ncbi:MAG: hypothetical protein PVH19_10775, partial [Planctomycetia bacterium]
MRNYKFFTMMLAAIVFLSTTGAVFAQTITFDSLLDEMVDRSTLANFPSPAYTCKQASSYDRHSVAA